MNEKVIRTDLKFERRPRSFREDPQIPRLIALPQELTKNVLLFFNICIYWFELSWGKLRREPATKWFD